MLTIISWILLSHSDGLATVYFVNDNCSVVVDVDVWKPLVALSFIAV